MSVRRYERMVCLALGFCLLVALACAGGSAAEDQSPEAKGSTELVELRIELPPPSWHQNGPKNVRSEILDPERRQRRPFMAPAGLSNMARGARVTSSVESPESGAFNMVTDGDKEAEERNFVELPAGPQWVQVDLGCEAELFAVVVWRYHRYVRVYHDAIIQLSNDPGFGTGVTTIYNNDQDNSMGLGAGRDWEWIETNEGRLIDAKGLKARYIRCYSNGGVHYDGENSSGRDHATNEYLEIEAYGRPAKP